MDSFGREKKEVVIAPPVQEIQESLSRRRARKEKIVDQLEQLNQQQLIEELDKDPKLLDKLESQISYLPQVNTGPASEKLDDEEFDDVELLGRGAKHADWEWEKIRTERRLVKSSNVYAYLYIPETKKAGILYVTFLYWQPGMKPEEREGPGPTYAYFDFPMRKYLEFEKATDSSAGAAVWDYCRVRGTRHGHQHRYYLVQAEGEYVPNKATAKGLAGRTLMPPGRSPRMQRKDGMRRYSSIQQKAMLNRGRPNRGEPNGGEPNRGR